MRHNGKKECLENVAGYNDGLYVVGVDLLAWLSGALHHVFNRFIANDTNLSIKYINKMKRKRKEGKGEDLAGDRFGGDGMVACDHDDLNVRRLRKKRHNLS